MPNMGHGVKTILYVVSHAYPYFSNGYAVRTHHIAKALAGQGVKPIVLTRPGRPWDVKAFTEQVTSLEVVEDGVRYLSLPEPSRSSFSNLDEWKEEAAKAIVELCRVYRVDIIMAASNWQTAMPAQRAAQLLGLDFYYEVRGFWELSKAARFAGHEESNEFKKHLAYETDMARGAKPWAQHRLVWLRLAISARFLTTKAWTCWFRLWLSYAHRG